MRLYRPVAGPLIVTLVAVVVSTLGVAAASADNLLVLNGESATVSGNLAYGIVYVDGQLNFAADTAITASVIYFGPNADVNPCFVPGTGPGTGDNACANGRSIGLTSPGAITVSSGLDLSGATGTPRNGGSLVINGGTVAIGGAVNASGTGGGRSGSVSITSKGPLNVGNITAPQGAVSLSSAGTLAVSGGITTAGSAAVSSIDAARAPYGGPISVSSSQGDVRINGAVSAAGADAAATTGLGGGTGSTVAISGANVHTGGIDVTGGASGDVGPGPSGTVAVAATGDLSILGRVDASGSSGPTGTYPGSTITLKGATVDAGDLAAGGGDGPNATAYVPGGAGGTVSVTSNGTASVGAVDTGGGNATATPGPGGRVAISSATGSIATGSVSAAAGQPSAGSGVSGGTISINAQTDLTASASVDASGSAGNGAADPPHTGGPGGTILLRAATGTLTLGGPVRSRGGAGGPESATNAIGGQGGAGARIDIVAHALGPISSIVSNGGSGGNNGDLQGVGGAAGPIYGWTDGPLFDDQKVVAADGGNGRPVGAAGGRHAELSPSAPTLDPITQKLSFTSNSPDATGYQLLRSVAGAPYTVVSTGPATSGLALSAPVCQPTNFTVVALQTFVGWVSATPGPVQYIQQPSKTQTCATPPKVKASKSALKFSLKALKHVHYKAVLKLTTTGIGSASASLIATIRTKVKYKVKVKLKAKKGHKPKTKTVTRTRTRTSTKTVLKLTAAFPKTGSQHVHLTFPSAARKRGTYTLKVVASSPDATKKATTNLKIEVVK